MKFLKNDEAVSPVIGVILMVAITVILAAVIAAFVFGMAGTVKKTYNVGGSATRQGEAVTVMYNGGGDADQVKSITYQGDASGTCPSGVTLAATCAVGGTTSTGSNSWAGTSATPGVGTYCQICSSAKSHVVVVAKFKDNTEQVILDNYV